MTTLLNRMFRNRCAACQVGQGRMCQCQGGAKVRNGKRRPMMTDTAWLWVLIVADVATLLAVGWLVAQAWRAWA